MNDLFNIIKVWAEAWAPLIPIYFLLRNRSQPKYMKPVIVYILLALPINTFADIIGDFHRNFADNYFLQVNIYLYNVHSVIRFVCFSYFFVNLRQEHYTTHKKTIPIVYLVFLIIDLTWFEDFFSATSIDSHLFLAEAFLLMVYCLLYYLSKVRDENDEITASADIYVVTGLSIFVVANFFVYLYYDSMMQTSQKMADQVWTVPNVAYTLFCLLLAKGFAVAGHVAMPKETLEKIQP